MYVYVCMYACMCMHVCVYVCMHVCMYVCMHVCMYACMYACMHVFMHACMHVCTYACMHACMHVRMYAYMHVCKYRHPQCPSANGSHHAPWLTAHTIYIVYWLTQSSLANDPYNAVLRTISCIHIPRCCQRLLTIFCKPHTLLLLDRLAVLFSCSPQKSPKKYPANRIFCSRIPRCC